MAKKAITQEQTERLQLRVSKDFLRLLDEWRLAQDIPASRTEAVRVAVEMAARQPRKKR
jgi:hypothetical protein